jgi:hypothetical protein
MDIHEGRLTGDFTIVANDAASWDFPYMYGKVACKGERGGGERVLELFWRG